MQTTGWKEPEGELVLILVNMPNQKDWGGGGWVGLTSIIVDEGSSS